MTAETTAMSCRGIVHLVHLVSSSVHKSDTVSHTHRCVTVSDNASTEPTSCHLTVSTPAFAVVALLHFTTYLLICLLTFCVHMYMLRKYTVSQ